MSENVGHKINKEIWDNPELQPFFIPHLVASDDIKHGEKSAGAYGFAKKVKCNGMEFAAKIIHRPLIQPGSVVVDNYIRECQLMSTLSHANIVQFLGLCHLPKESELPLLVMELMANNLHCYLLNEGNIPLSLRQSFLEDVAKGLDYLHSLIDPIIHRDLTATNVLLNSALVAKISDFGNSRLLPNDFNPKKLSNMPGTALYMPPEASRDDYTTDLDIFSFGHLALFTLTQVFPDELLEPTFKNEEFGQRAGRSEVERRAIYFEILVNGMCGGKNDEHPLVVLVKECLANEPAERPTARDIIRRLQQETFSKDLTHIAMELEDKDTQLKQTKAQLQHTIAELQQKNNELTSLEKQLGEIVSQTPTASSESDGQFQLEASLTQRLREPPIHMSSHPHAIVIEDKVYIGGGYAMPNEKAATILVFDSQSRSWSTLPKCPTKYFGLATTHDGKVAVVAGTHLKSGSKTGHVYIWDPKLLQTEWEKFKCTSMLKYRSSVSVVSYEQWLIAVGGEGIDGMIVDDVEKLDTTAEENKRHWTSCAKLATKSSRISLSIVDDKVFAFCTSTKVPTSSVAMPSNTVFFASIMNLLESNADTPQTEVWQEIKHLPIKSSTAVAFKGSLLALGGIETGSFKNVSTGIYRYDLDSDDEAPSAKWKKVGDLPYPVYQCASIELCNKVLVYGKSEEHGTCVYVHKLN